MKNYKLHVYFRHFIKDEDTLKRYKKIVNRVNRAAKLAKQINFNIIVNFDPKMSQHLKDQVSDISKKLIEQNIEFSIRVGHGAGIALFDAMEEIISNMSIDREDFLLCVIDGDSYPIDDAAFLRQLRKLANAVHENKALMGLSQRSKVILGKGDFEIYREINEIYLALAMKPHLPVKKSKALNVPLAYAKHGDPVPGFYCMNATHPSFIKLFERVEKDCEQGDMTRFTGDHYLVLAASQMGKIETEFVPLEDNPPGGFKWENIRQMSREIARTSMRQVFLDAVRSKKNFDLLCECYPEEMVKKVQDVILDSIKKA